MTRQSSSFHRITTRSGVRPRSAWLPLLLALLAACAYDERLSLGRHDPAQPPSSPPLLPGGAAGGAALDPAAPQVSAPAPDPPAPASPRAPEPAAEPAASPDAGVPPAAADAAAAAEPCASNRYVADLSCAVDPSMLRPGSDPRLSMPMSTAVSFAVEPSQTPGWLEIRGGTLEFEYLGSAFLGRLSGGLDCATSEFHAEIVDGSYQALFGGAVRPGGFQGEVVGRLAPSSPTLSGSWWHGPADVPEGALAPSCVGTWTARPAP